MILEIPDRQFPWRFSCRARAQAKADYVQQGIFMFKSFVPIFIGLLIATSAHAVQTRTLRIGNQSVTLTSDKRSAPALAVQMPEGDIWYGFLTSGTAPGRLTVQMPSGDIFSLIPPTNHTFSTILADFPQIYTWDLAFRNTNPRWGNQNVTWGNYEASLSIPLSGQLPIWPNFHIQATCSSTTGTYAVKGNPVLPNPANGNTAFASTERQCWCRLKQRSDSANGGWTFDRALSTAADCALWCPDRCTDLAANRAAFRAALFDAFVNP